MDDDQPGPTDDPRQGGTGDGGYPEESPAADGGSNDESSPRAPETSSPDEGDAGQATGNPDNAG